MQAIFQVAQGRHGEDELLVGVRLDHLPEYQSRCEWRQWQALKLLGGQFVALRDNAPRFFMFENPRSPQADHNPFCFHEMPVSRFQTCVDLLQKRGLRGVPKSRVVSEGAILAFANANHFLMRKRLAIGQAFDRLHDAVWII